MLLRWSAGVMATPSPPVLLKEASWSRRSFEEPARLPLAPLTFRRARVWCLHRPVAMHAHRRSSLDCTRSSQQANRATPRTGRATGSTSLIPNPPAAAIHKLVRHAPEAPTKLFSRVDPHHDHTAALPASSEGDATEVRRSSALMESRAHACGVTLNNHLLGADQEDTLEAQWRS
jgi:hypothetical protein